jgi:small subunit ribosomal protein S3
MLNEDIKVRQYLGKKLAHASVSRVLIERPAKNARITVFSARPGVVIGKKGEDIELLKADLQKIVGVPVHVNIEEVRKPETDAQLIADSIAQQLEKRIMFRRAMKRAMQNAMRLGAQGIKIMSAGRLNGAEIARTEWYREGRVPLHTLRANIDYGFSEAKTTYGIIGIKVWVFKGEILGRGEQPASAEPTTDDARRPRRPRSARPEGEGEARPTGLRRAAKKETEGAEVKPESETGDAAPKSPAKRVRKSGASDAAASEKKVS